MHHLNQRTLGAPDQFGVAGHSDGVEEDAEVHRTVFLRCHDPRLDLADEIVDRLRPLPALHHHIARAGRKSEALQRTGKHGAKGLQFVLGHRFSKEKAVVLVRANRLLAASFRAHHHQASHGADRGRCRQIEQFVEQATIEVGRDLRDNLHLDPLPVEPFDLRLNIVCGASEIIDRVRTIDASWNKLRVAGHEAKDINIFQHPYVFAVRPYREAPLVVARHLDECLEDEVIVIDGHHIEVANVAHLGVEWRSIKYNRFRQVHPGYDAASPPVAYVEGIGVPVAHGCTSGLDARCAIDKHSRMESCIAYSRPKHGVDALGFLKTYCRSELVRDLRVEKRRESSVSTDQIQDELPGSEVTQCLLGCDEARTRCALHECAGIEALLLAKDGFELVSVALLHRPLNDDVKSIRRLVLFDDDFARPEITDIENSAQLLDLLMA